MCEVELRPYVKVGRKKARQVLGCARLPEKDNPDLDGGVFHKFLKIDFAAVCPSENKDLAQVSPTFLATVYTKVDDTKAISGRAEILLASLCGYKNLNGEAVLRHPHHNRYTDYSDKHNHAGARSTFQGSGSKGDVDFDEADACCPVAAVDKVIPLLEDESSYATKSGGGMGSRCAGQGGKLRLRALFVPDRLADAPGVRSAIKVRACGGWNINHYRL